MADKKPKGAGCLVMVLIGLGVLIAIGAESSNQPSTNEPAEVAASPPSPPSAPSCESDWRSCKDTTDLVNNSSVFAEAQRACVTEATSRAKYGDPKFPSIWEGGAFSHFYLVPDAPKTGMIRMEERRAQFENGFGAMVHVDLTCTYDFNAKAVADLTINQD
jgi:hypothetical protein